MEDICAELTELTPRIVTAGLPAYSPNLNPDEMLNQYVKANAIGRQKPRTEKETTNNLRIFLCINSTMITKESKNGCGRRHRWNSMCLRFPSWALLGDWRLSTIT
jgi:hypothetical protein